jgi:hypothetical protein
LGDPTLAATAREAYVDDMTLVLGVCVVVALVGAALVRRLMPAWRARSEARPFSDHPVCHRERRRPALRHLLSALVDVG